MLYGYDRHLSHAIPPSLVEEFLSSLRIKADSKRCYATALTVLNDWMCTECVTAFDATVDDMTEYRDWLEANRAHRSAQMYLSVTKRFFEWLSARDQTFNPMTGVRLHRRDFYEPSAELTLDEALRALDASLGDGGLIGLRDHAVLSLLLRCAMRPGEINEADVGDYVRHAGGGEIRVRNWGKRGKRSYVAIGWRAANALDAYLEARGWPEPDEPLFASHSRATKDGRLNRTVITIIAKNAMKAAGVEVPGATAYSLRRASMLLAEASGAPMAAVAGLAVSRGSIVIQDTLARTGHGLALAPEVHDLVMSM